MLTTILLCIVIFILFLWLILVYYREKAEKEMYHRWYIQEHEWHERQGDYLHLVKLEKERIEYEAEILCKEILATYRPNSVTYLNEITNRYAVSFGNNTISKNCSTAIEAQLSAALMAFKNKHIQP